MNGYTPIAINLATRKPAIHHYLYVRKHHTKSEADLSAIFIAGLPHDTTLDNIKDLCTAMGSVILEKFEYQGNNRGLLHLVDDAACTRFLSKAAKAKKVPEWALYGPRGSDGYLMRHELRFPSEESLQTDIDTYMEEYAELEAARKRDVKNAAVQVDADGFQMVVNTKRKQLPGTPVSVKRKKRAHEKADFYRFQLRENKKQEMNELLKRYQLDKAKVEELKKKKMLKPY